MDDFHSIQIREDRMAQACWVTIDGMELRGVMGIDIQIDHDGTPRVILEIIPRRLEMDDMIVVDNGKPVGGVPAALPPRRRGRPRKDG